MITQTRDEIKFNGSEYYLGSGQCPLELLFKDDNEVLLSIWDQSDIPDEDKIPRPDFDLVNGLISQ